LPGREARGEHGEGAGNQAESAHHIAPLNKQLTN
jgi:hypothetical protein